MHLKYQLTTDVALAEGRGPSLVDRWGVLFPGGEDFLPATLASTLSGFVKGGGRVAVFGTGSFRGVTHITGFPSAPARERSRSSPRWTPSAPSAARSRPPGGELITELTDALGLFSGTVAFSGFSQYQPIQPPSGATISAAGIADGSSAIVAFRYGSGTVDRGRTARLRREPRAATSTRRSCSTTSGTCSPRSAEAADATAARVAVRRGY